MVKDSNTTTLFTNRYCLNSSKTKLKNDGGISLTLTLSRLGGGGQVLSYIYFADTLPPYQKMSAGCTVLVSRKYKF